MQIIILYGPPAVGKLTIAKELRKRLGYTLFHNHLILNALAEIFGFDKPEKRNLVREFRLRILEEAVKDNTDMIITIGVAGNAIFEHLDAVIQTIEAKGGRVCLVYLTTDRETLLSRVENASRKDEGKYFGKEKLMETLVNNPDIFHSYPKREHLKIDTTYISPQVAAETIIAHYQLLP